MKMFVFEGTPEEIGEVAKSMLSTPVGDAISVGRSLEARPAETRAADSEGTEKFVSPEFARRALTRLPISEQLNTVLRVLNDAHPDWVPLSELYEATGYTYRQFGGMMGSFSRRLVYTEGYDEAAHFFEWRRNEETKEWECRLPDSVREVLSSDTGV